MDNFLFGPWYHDFVSNYYLTTAFIIYFIWVIWATVKYTKKHRGKIYESEHGISVLIMGVVLSAMWPGVIPLGVFIAGPVFAAKYFIDAVTYICNGGNPFKSILRKN